MIHAEISSRTLQMMRTAMSEAFLVPVTQLPRVLFHAIILSFIIGGFWLLDSLKDPILAASIGMEYQPVAKLLSVVVTLIVVCAYDFTTSLVTKPTLFHIISIMFGLIFAVIAALLSDPNVGLPNHHKNPMRLLGWFSYFAIEAYGSLMVALFWSFTNSIMNLEQAKGAYGLIISIAQFGSILGSTLATHAVPVGISQLYFIGSITVFSVSLLIKLYHIVFRDKVTVKVETGRVRSVTETSDAIDAYDTPEKRSLWSILQGFYEGLYLISQYQYVALILGVSCLYEVVITILDYEFKVLGAQSVTDHRHQFFDENDTDSSRFANLLGHFGQFTNLLSLAVSSVGFSFLVHRIGVRGTLLIFPLLLFIAVLVINLVPSLWILFILVSVLKALTYSLNDPVKELLYQPTSEPIKFKAKAWIDVFGARLAKAAGSLITRLGHGDSARLRAVAEVPTLVISLALIVVAVVAGNKFDALIREGKIIGEEEPKEQEMSMYSHLPVINGIKPGEVGYTGYDSKLFEGVFPEEEKSSDAASSSRPDRYYDSRRK